MNVRLLFLLSLLGAPAFLQAQELPALWAERIKCVVAVEYVTET
jgi:hypothetical protein